MRRPRCERLRGAWALLAFALVSIDAWGKEPIRFISHRGESKDAPENTMAAFRLAIERKVAGFECDVYLTADNEIVCIHDGTTKRTTDGNRVVTNATLAQLRALDAGSWKGSQYKGERIPTLAEALSLARNGCEIYVEVKSGTNILPRLKQVVAAEPKATPERMLFICFNTNVVKALRRELPQYRTYWLTGFKRGEDGRIKPSAASVIATLKATGANGVDAQASSMLDAAYVKAIRDAGYSFHVWTVNDAAWACACAAMGAETITTDCGAFITERLSPRIQAGSDDTVFAPDYGVTQTVEQAISGNGGVIANPGGVGGGVVVLNGLNTYTGPTTLGCGTLLVKSLADGRKPSAIGASSPDASNLVLANGTLRYVGPAVTTDRGYTIRVDPANTNSAAVLCADGDITFRGNINAVCGNFIKCGSGTVTYAGSGLNQMSCGQSVALGSVINFLANGDSPSAGYSGFTVAAGKVVLGTAPMQSTRFTGELVVGTRTTEAADLETEASLDIVGGKHQLGSYLAIGRANGTAVTAPSGLASRVTLSGGTVRVDNLSMAYSAKVEGYNARPVLDVSGGSLEIKDAMRIGDHAGGHPVVNLSGGRVTANTFVSGLYGATDARVNLTGGAVLDIKGACNLANMADSFCTLALHGGRLKARGVFDAHVKGNGVLFFNGGVFEARQAGAEGVAASVRAVVSARGAVFDTDPIGANGLFAVHAGLLHDAALGTVTDGGLVKTGRGTLMLAGVNTYNGPTLISNGTLRLAGSLPANASLTVLPGGCLALAKVAVAPMPLATLMLGTSGSQIPCVLELAVAPGAGASVAAAKVTGAGSLGIRLVPPGTTDAQVEDGTYSLLTYDVNGSVPLDPAAVTIMNPVPGKVYRFAVADTEGVRKQLTVTVSAKR